MLNCHNPFNCLGMPKQNFVISPHTLNFFYCSFFFFLLSSFPTTSTLIQLDNPFSKRQFDLKEFRNKELIFILVFSFSTIILSYFPLSTFSFFPFLLPQHLSNLIIFSPKDGNKFLILILEVKCYTSFANVHSKLPCPSNKNLIQ